MTQYDDVTFTQMSGAIQDQQFRGHQPLPVCIKRLHMLTGLKGGSLWRCAGQG